MSKPEYDELVPPQHKRDQPIVTPKDILLGVKGDEEIRQPVGDDVKALAHLVARRARRGRGV